MKDIGNHDPKATKGRDVTEKKGVDWKAQEKRLAKRTGGRQPPGSGAVRGKPGDVSCRDRPPDAEIRPLLIEAKTTAKKSLRLERRWLEKVTEEAACTGKTPALAITFDDMPPGTDPDWVMVPLHVLQALGIAD